MPPKVVKRGGAARRGGRLTRSALKAQSPLVNEESVDIGEISGSDALEAKEVTPEVDKTVEEENPLDGPKPLDSIDDSEAAANPVDVVLSKIPLYPKASLKRDYDRRDDLPPPRSRPAVSYSSRLSPESHLSYRDDYPPRGSGYSDLPRSSSRSEMRRPFVEDPYSPRFERPPSYSEGRPRAYEPLPGSKRPYAGLDDIPPRYADVDVRHSRPRLDYDVGPSQYGESYGDRIPRSSLGYGSSRNSMSSHDSRGPYSSRQGMDYGGGSYSGSDVGGMYSSSYGGDLPRRDGGGSSYSSIYSSRGLGGSSYSSGGPGSYY